MPDRRAARLPVVLLALCLAALGCMAPTDQVGMDILSTPVTAPGPPSFNTAPPIATAPAIRTAPTVGSTAPAIATAPAIKTAPTVGSAAPAIATAPAIKTAPTVGSTAPAIATAPAIKAVSPFSTEPPTPAMEVGASVVIGGVSFEAELAVGPDERAKGLSGRSGLPPKTGMLFVYESSQVLSFWMKEMQFPLDFVWIGEDCTVVSITPDVPAPAPGAAVTDLPRYSPTAPAAYNFEINAGEADKYGLAEGDPVRIYGLPAGVENPCG